MNNRYPRHIFFASLAIGAVLHSQDDASAGGGQAVATKPVKSNPIFKQFDTDTGLEKNGVKVEYVTGEEAEGEEPMYIMLARAGGSNLAYNNLLEHKLKPLQRRLRTDNVSSAELDKIYLEVYVKTVIKGWGNVRDEEMNLIPYSEKNVLDYLKRLPDLFEDIKSQAQKSSLYHKAEVEAIAKN